MVAADLIDAQGNRLVLVRVLALDHQHRDAVDEKDDILPRAVVAVVKSELFGDFVNVAPPSRSGIEILVIDQDQVALPLFLVIEEFSPIAQVLDEFAVAVDVDVDMAKLPEQRTFGLGITRIEFPHLGVEQLVEEERQRSPRNGGRTFLSAVPRQPAGWKTRPPFLGFLPRHKHPADGLGIFEDPGLDGFVFGGCGH